MPTDWIQQGQSPGLFESLYRTLVEPILGQTPSTALPPQGQMPGQPVPPQQGPGVSDIMKLAAIPAAGMGGIAPLLLGLLGSSVMGEAGGRLGEQIGSLGGQEWGERGRQVGTALGQFAIPGEKMPLLEAASGRYEPFRLKRPEVELPPQEELTRQIQDVVRKNPARYTEWFNPETKPLLGSDTHRQNYVGWNPQLAAAMGDPATGKTNKLLSLNEARLPVRTADFPITTAPEYKWLANDPQVDNALNTVSTIFPRSFKTLKGVHIEDPSMMGGAAGSYDPDTGIMHISPSLINQKNHLNLIGVIAHELKHHAQHNPALKKALGVDAVESDLAKYLYASPEFEKLDPETIQRKGMATVDVLEPPAFHREQEIHAMTQKALRGESPKLTKEEKAVARSKAQERWERLRPYYEKKWKTTAEDLTRSVDEEDLGDEDMPADLLNKIKRAK